MTAARGLTRPVASRLSCCALAASCFAALGPGPESTMRLAFEPVMIPQLTAAGFWERTLTLTMFEV